MKKLVFMASALFILSCATPQTTETTDNQSHRNTENSGVRNNNSIRTNGKNVDGIPVGHNIKFIHSYMDETYGNLQNAVKGLTSEQLNFKSAPDRWSILECMEHIAVSQNSLFEMAIANLKKAPNPELRSEIKVTDDDIMSMMVNRSHKAQAPNEMKPSGKFKDAQSALNQIQANQNLMIQGLNGITMEDLRNHVVDAPVGKIDAYQFMLFIPGHTARHTLQIQEIKNDPKFPK